MWPMSMFYYDLNSSVVILFCPSYLPVSTLKRLFPLEGRRPQ